MSIRPRARSNRLLMVTLVTVSLLVITFDFRQGPTGPLDTFGSAAHAALAPFQKGVSKVTNPIGSFFSAVAHLPSLQEENQQLKAERDAALAAQIKNADDLERLKTLEELLAIQAGLSPDTKAAVVIGSSVSNFEWTITLDKGSRDGVQVGSAVVASPGTESEPGLLGALVGRVIRVTPYSSDVLLLLDPEFKVAGRLFSSGETGLVEGRGDEDLRMALIASTAPVRLDDIVSTVAWDAGGPQGEQNRYPPGIVIGRVSRILASAGSPDKYVEVRPTVDFSALETVLVVVRGSA